MKRTTICVGVVFIASAFLWILIQLSARQTRSVQAVHHISDAPSVAISASAAALTPPLRLNEFMVDNRSTIHDAFGDFDSWIELYNMGLLPLDVGGMALGVPTNLWKIPTDTVIPGQGFLLVWADGEPDEGAYHASFALSPGQVISLYDKELFDSKLLDQSPVTVTPPDWSLGRRPNGYGSWTVFVRPSPGAHNATHWTYLPLVSLVDASSENTIVINEFMAANSNTLPDEAGEYDDWIELYNHGSQDVDLGGMYLSDDLGDLPRWQIPAGTVIPAYGYLLFWADGQQEQGPLHTSFKLDRDGEMVLLVDTDGYSLHDSIVFSAQQSDVSFGRLPDGADNWQFFSDPTPGSPNALTSIRVGGTAHQPSAPGASDSVTVTTHVTAAYLPITVTLFYSAGTGTFPTVGQFTQTTMREIGDGLYRAQIPPHPAYTFVRYYVQARDNLGQTATDPAEAPTDTHQYAVELPLGTLFLNELMAANTTVFNDSAGDFDDWIELHNSGSTPVDLGGYFLTNDLQEPTRWHIPYSLTIPACPPQVADESYGRSGDGGPTWLVFSVPTPGKSNPL